MSFDQKTFEAKVPPFIFPVVEELSKLGYLPILVGGVVRDYFLTGELGLDWDMELSHETLPFDRGTWKDLGKNLSRFGRTSFLPYDVIRLQINSYQLEISPPRIEHFDDNLKGHSNFTAEFDFKLPFSEAVKRRDFTINTMGIRLKDKKNIEFLDPLKGLEHLRDKVLHYAGPDFAKDPIRFLRAHRFANRFKFSFSKELKAVLDSMPLEGITPSYLWSETKKALDPVNFISFLVQEKNEHLKLPLTKEFTQKVPEIKKVLTDPRKHETWIVALEWIGLSSSPWAQYFAVATDSAKRLARWAQLSKEFQTLLPESFHGEFDRIIENKNFDKVFDWYFTTKQLLQKNNDLPLMNMIEEFIPSWIHLYRFDVLKDVKHIDPPLRAKYQVWNLCQRL